MLRPHPRIQAALLAAGLLLAADATAEPSPDALLGRYWFPDRSGQVELYRHGGRIHGRVVAYRVPDQLDERNPDPKLRTRRFVGIDMFVGFRFDPESARWVGGTIYDARKGRIYDCTLWFEGDDRSVLWARGYVGFAIFGRTERFERVEAAS